jgi:hypothetical protein
METRREASAGALPLQGVVHIESSQVSLGDCFAALLKSSSSLRRSIGGFLPALSFQLSIVLLPFTSSSRFEIVVMMLTKQD